MGSRWLANGIFLIILTEIQRTASQDTTLVTSKVRSGSSGHNGVDVPSSPSDDTPRHTPTPDAVSSSAAATLAGEEAAAAVERAVEEVEREQGEMVETVEAVHEGEEEEEEDPDGEEGPHFAKNSPKEVSAAAGVTALIPCKARNLRSKSVSWIRNRDLHMLTVGSFSFTNDQRFSAHRDTATGDWVLVIRKPKPSDSGFYECSISTKPAITHTVNLKVVVPSVEMVGGREVYLDRGSTLNLSCVVHFSPQPPEYILWYHGEMLVNYENRGRQIKVETKHRGNTTWSSLLVHNATLRDSGRYSCQPSNANKVSIGVHVLKSETPAAMQTTTSGTQSLLLRRQATFLRFSSLAPVAFSAALCLLYASLVGVPAFAAAAGVR
ncbi:zwei Ig domain protein zig-8-like isoform X2 [Oratosquilla oratoria]|uniref:zwei Ig domain protein zig-8-like isoform X2 n=1 Tax=Oratosquilla oratoria TaxID=337810 RepID=UPI003F75D96A